MMKIRNKFNFVYILVVAALLFGCAKTADVENTQFAYDASVTSELPASTTKKIDSTEDVAVSETPVASPAVPFEFSTEIAEMSDKPELTEQEISDVQAQYRSITGTLKIVYLDVGQGDSIYIGLPNGESMLIDAGESSASESIIQYIKDNNDKGSIDYLIASHPHSDHIGGMAAVINALEIKSVWMPAEIHNTKTFENLLDTIEENNLTIKNAKADKVLFDYGNLKAVFIAPNGSGYSNLNNYSAVILLTYNDRRFLFMGDAEEESEAEILAAVDDISADVLKVGHHGSSTSSAKAFIKAVSPKYAVISCGKGNSYGHPTNQTLAILAEFGIGIKRTDENGTIIFSCDGENISCTTFLRTEIQPCTPTAVPSETSETSTVKETPAKTQEQSITVYVTKTGEKYHSDGCRYLSQSKIIIELEAAKQKYDPCSVCSPPR